MVASHHLVRVIRRKGYAWRWQRRRDSETSNLHNLLTTILFDFSQAMLPPLMELSGRPMRPVAVYPTVAPPAHERAIRARSHNWLTTKQARRRALKVDQDRRQKKTLVDTVPLGCHRVLSANHRCTSARQYKTRCPILAQGGPVPFRRIVARVVRESVVRREISSSLT